MFETLIGMLEPGVHMLHALAPSRVHFETPEGGGGGESGTETAVVEPVVDPANVPASTEDAAEPTDVELENAGMSRQDYVAMAREGAGAAFQEMLAEAERQEIASREAAAAQQANELPAWDPFDPEVVKAHNLAAMREVLGPLIEAIQPALEQTEKTRMSEGRTEATELLEGYKAELGDFDNDRAILSASRYMNQGLEPEAALERAAQEEATYVKGIEDRAYARFRDPAQNLADTAAEPSGGAGAAAEVSVHPGKPGARLDYKTELRGSLARLGKGPGVSSPTG